MPILSRAAQPVLRPVARQAAESGSVTSPTTTTTVAIPESIATHSPLPQTQMTMIDTNFTPSPTQLVAGPEANPSATSSTDSPFFPSPTGDSPEENRGLQFRKHAVEAILIAATALLILIMASWRIVRLRRKGLPLSEFFRAHPQPDVPSRPRDIPRTTGLPLGNGRPVSVIYDTLSAPVPLMHRGEQGDRRRGRGRRTRAGDIDSGGRRGTAAHPDDPDEFLPEYDDKDVLPRYQDLQRANGVLEGRSPNVAAGTNDTIPLVTTLHLSSSATLEDQGGASAGSHDGHGRHDGSEDTPEHPRMPTT